MSALATTGRRVAPTAKEELELTKINQLTPAQMDEMRNEALALETRACVYASTKPAHKR
jgi:hypothetical protein